MRMNADDARAMKNNQPLGGGYDNHEHSSVAQN